MISVILTSDCQCLKTQILDKIIDFSHLQTIN